MIVMTIMIIYHVDCSSLSYHVLSTIFIKHSIHSIHKIDMYTNPPPPPSTISTTTTTTNITTTTTTTTTTTISTTTYYYLLLPL